MISDFLKDAANLKNAHKIVGIAPERIMKEILKMAEQSGDKFASAIETMDRVGLLQHIFPEISVMKDMSHSPEHHPESPHVFGHIMSSLSQYSSSDPVVNMSILFHDVGKAVTHHVGEEGYHHYYGHDRAGIQIILAVADRMKWEHDLRDSCVFCAENHMKVHDLYRMGDKKILIMMNSPYWETLYTVSDADTKSRLHLFNPDRWALVGSKVAQLASKFGGSNPMSSLKKIVNGGLIMRIKGITKPGKNIGEIQDRAISYIIKHSTDISDIAEIERIVKRS